MCMNLSEGTPSYCRAICYGFRLRRLSKRNNIRVQGLNNRKRKLDNEAYYNNITKERETRVEMVIKNFELYVENESIKQENQKLRNKAMLLRQENQALLSQLQRISSHPIPNYGKNLL